MPAWVRYAIGCVVALIVAFVLAGLLPPPLSTIVFWIAIIVAVVCGGYALYLLIAPGPRRRV